MKIDIGTLTLVVGLFAVIQAGILMYQYRLDQTYRGIGFWALGSIAAAAGFALRGLRSETFLQAETLLLSNLLLASPLFFYHIGIARFFGKKERHRFLVALWIGYVVIFSYYTLIRDDSSIRVILASILAAGVSFMNVRALMVDRIPSVREPIFLTVASFLIYGVFFTFRAVDMVVLRETYSYFTPTFMQCTMFFVIFISSNLATFGFISMVNQRLHAEMRESKERFEIIFNTSPDAALISGLPDGRIVDVNDGFLALSGYTRGETVGRLSSEVNLWKEGAERKEFIAEVQVQGFCENMEASFLGKDGREIRAIVSGKVTSLQGVPHMISIARDISARHQAEDAVRRSEALYRSILSASPDGVVVTDLTGKILMASPKILAMVGLEREEELLGKNHLDFLFPEERERARENIGLMFQGVFTGPGEYRVAAAGGRNIVVESNAEFVRDLGGAPSRLVFIVREISDRKQAEEEHRHNIAVQMVLKEIAETALLSTTLEDLYGKVHQWVGQVLPAKNFYIALQDDVTGEISLPYCADETKTLPLSRPAKKGLTEYVLRQGKSVHITAKQFDQLCEAGEVDLIFGNIKQEWLGAPLVDGKGKYFGIIAVNLIETDQSIQPLDIEVLSIIAAQVSMAIDHKRLEEELRQQAASDGLTGILNRRYFLIRAEAELKRIQRYKGDCALMILDIDHFKSVNDTYGHFVGDVALQQVASICRTVLRDTDVFGRIGGEEFAAFLLETHEADCLKIAERLRQKIYDTSVVTERGLQVPVSVSVGVTGVRLGDETISKIMIRADQALYQAKAEGRNRVVLKAQ